MNQDITHTARNLKDVKLREISLEEVIANIREAIDLYLETLSSEERKDSLRREILTTALEVSVA
jgi:hypothetical protein